MISELGEFGVDVRLPEGTYNGGTTGTGHGTAYFYDRTVPIVFIGAGVRAGHRNEIARTVDLAPTLAHLAGSAAPGDLDGRVLSVD
jgi:arylsulfatase A-like enzyme